MAKRTNAEYKVTAYIRVSSIPEDINGKNHRERIAPQLVPADEYFNADTNDHAVRREWTRRKEKAALSAFFGSDAEIY